jgi:hypothetical protein
MINIPSSPGVKLALLEAQLLAGGINRSAFLEGAARPGTHLTPRPFLPGPYSEDSAYFSPSTAGESPRWIAYTSDETGKDEVHVRNFPAGDRSWRVSSDGGWQPHWRRDGRELFYLKQDGTLMAVELKTNAAKDGAEFDFGPPRELFRTGVRPYRGPPQVKANAYAVSRDGRRFLVNRMASDAPVTTAPRKAGIHDHVTRSAGDLGADTGGSPE